MNLERVQSSTSENRKKILVLEDDILWQKIIRFCVLKAHENAEIEFMSSAKEFHLSGANHKSFDLIISDYYLAEGQTGIEFWKQLQNENCSVPFVMTSGCESSKMMELCVGEDSPPIFLEKTIAGNAFADNLSKILDAPAPKIKKTKNFKIGFYETLLMLMILGGVSFGPRLFTQGEDSQELSSAKATKASDLDRKPASEPKTKVIDEKDVQ